ncbi:Uncharacterised protein [Vibrio cholerae]|nr:Uncharacterised protein [Vibrio cholerae]CSC41962.1 Uncharacterised protein [Vibrio cholerae]
MVYRLSLNPVDLVGLGFVHCEQIGCPQACSPLAYCLSVYCRQVCPDWIYYRCSDDLARQICYHAAHQSPVGYAYAWSQNDSRHDDLICGFVLG